jgi:hypothetical protein
MIPRLKQTSRGDGASGVGFRGTASMPQTLRKAPAARPLVPLGLVGLMATIATPVAAKIIPVEDMQRGITISKRQCVALRNAVWVQAYKRDFCVRYYLSTAGGKGRRPLVYLSGDKLGVLKNGTFPEAGTKGIDTADLMKFAKGMSRQAKTPGIYLARIGIDGTSGHHRARRTVLELAMVDAALSAIRRRHRFDGFHLVGQSGGSGLIGGLLGRRSDIGCAVPGSGRLAFHTPPKTVSDPGQQYFDSSASIPAIIRNGARILLVTDPADERVLVEYQIEFVRRMRKAGGKVQQFFARANGKIRHGVTQYARYVAAACIAGKSDHQIESGLAKLVAKRLANGGPNTLPQQRVQSLQVGGLIGPINSKPDQ